MRTTEHAYRWEVDGLEHRLHALEERLDRRDRERLHNAMLLFWLIWAAGLGGIVALVVLS